MDVFDIIQFGVNKTALEVVSSVSFTFRIYEAIKIDETDDLIVID